MQNARLFKYDTYVTAVVVTGHEGTINMPISNTKIKAFKGSNQPIKFGIFDSDGIAFEVIAGTSLGMVVIDTRYDREVLTKELVVSTDDVTIPGRVKQSIKRAITYYECTLTLGDLQDLDAGDHYKYVVYEKDSHGLQGEYLYTALDYEVPGDFEVLETAAVQFKTSTDTGPNPNWLKVTPGVGNSYNNMDPLIVGDRANAIGEGWVWYSSTVYPADAQLGYHDGLHTAAIYPNNLTGTLKISASLANTVPSMDFNQWFSVPDSTGQIYHEFTSDSTIKQINFTGNFMWIRYDLYVRDYGDSIPVPPVGFPTQGSLTKILFRI